MRGETAFMPGIARAMAEQWGFQSTHPMRGETAEWEWFDELNGFQSTHPMRGETFTPTNPLMALYISIHSPHAG